MKNIVLLYILFFSGFVFSQNRDSTISENKSNLFSGISIGLSNSSSVHLRGGYNQIGINFFAGLKGKMNCGSIAIYGVYQLASPVSDFNRINNLLGGQINFLFFKKSKIKLYINLSALTSVGSNHKLSFMSIISDDHPVNSKNQYKYFQKYGFVMDEYLDYYVSTPFAGNLFLGSDFKLIEQLHLNVALGIGTNVLKVYYGKWIPKISEEQIEKYPIKIKKRLMWSFHLGLNYTLPFHKSN